MPDAVIATVSGTSASRRIVALCDRPNRDRLFRRDAERSFRHVDEPQLPVRVSGAVEPVAGERAALERNECARHGLTVWPSNNDRGRTEAQQLDGDVEGAPSRDNARRPTAEAGRSRCRDRVCGRGDWKEDSRMRRSRRLPA